MCIGQLEINGKGKEGGEGKAIGREGEVSVMKEDNSDCEDQVKYSKVGRLADFVFSVHR